MTHTEKNGSGEAPTDDPRDKGDETSISQTDKPWKHNPQRSTDPSLPDTPNPDLEKWRESNTH